jgi:hypothetical protein
MPILCRVPHVAALFCCITAGATAQSSFDATHCYIVDQYVIENAGTYRVNGIQQRGIIRSNSSGGELDNASTRCAGAIATIGDARTGGGFCEFAMSREDRVLIRYTVDGRGGSSTFVSGTGRYKGVSGQLAFQAMQPIASVEPNVTRACNRITGEFKLP